MKNNILSIVKILVRAVAKFDRVVVKRYAGVETPLYKIWWAAHSSYMQNKLDMQRLTF